VGHLLKGGSPGVNSLPGILKTLAIYHS